MVVPRLVIAGTHSGVGKTTVTLALLGTLLKRGRLVQAFKVGPDFIDPGHHTAVAKRPSRNLDGWMLDAAANRETLGRAGRGVDLCLIEGMMGLFDGSASTSDRGSTAEMARLVQAPVLLVVDGSALARSAAALVSGYSRFDPNLRVAAVLFNRVNSEGHYRLLKEAVEQTAGVPAVGYLPCDQEMVIADRHLGLVTAQEQLTTSVYDRLADAIAATVDLERVEEIARSAEDLPIPTMTTNRHGRSSAVGLRAPRIGVALDAAFCFYYQDNLEWLEHYGAELVYFSPLHDRMLPAVDGLYLGGGYPEVHAATLAGNCDIRQAVLDFGRRGQPIYAECGGLMYLMDAICANEERRYEMVGFFSGQAVMNQRACTIGYRTLEITSPCWLGPVGMTVKGHEFHYSAISHVQPAEYIGCITDAARRHGRPEGLARQNVIALYTHLHFGSQPQVAAQFVKACAAAPGFQSTPAR